MRGTVSELGKLVHNFLSFSLCILLDWPIIYVGFNQANKQYELKKNSHKFAVDILYFTDYYKNNNNNVCSNPKLLLF